MAAEVRRMTEQERRECCAPLIHRQREGGSAENVACCPCNILPTCSQNGGYDREYEEQQERRRTGSEPYCEWPDSKAAANSLL